jgi:hypothetical protein
MTVLVPINKDNNKITELRTILQGKVQTHNYINSQQPENCENRKTTLYVIVDKIFQTPVL